MTLIDTDRRTVVSSDPYTLHYLARYGVPEPRESCKQCGSRPARFVYVFDFEIEAPWTGAEPFVKIERVKSGRFSLIDAEAFCTIGCWKNSRRSR